MCLGYHITEAYFVRVIVIGRASRNHTATCPFCVLWPPLPSNINLPESSLSIDIMDCSTNVV